MLELPMVMFIALFAVLGLCAGSFLNVVILRLPRILEQQTWHPNSHLAESTLTPVTLTLSQPRSHCPNCHHRLRWYENIPIVSFFLVTQTLLRLPHAH